jgi:hypothetical protein
VGRIEEGALQRCHRSVNGALTPVRVNIAYEANPVCFEWTLGTSKDESLYIVFLITTRYAGSEFVGCIFAVSQ